VTWADARCLIVCLGVCLTELNFLGTCRIKAMGSVSAWQSAAVSLECGINRLKRASRADWMRAVIQPGGLSPAPHSWPLLAAPIRPLQRRS
jgi:hypothetical protein